MPTRILRDYTDSLKFDGISADSERLWIRLIAKADDFGRYYGDPRLIKAHCFPLHEDMTSRDIEALLEDLEQRRLIIRYESAGKRCIAIVNYGQRLRQSHAKFPPLAGKPEDFLPIDSNLPQLAAASSEARPESDVDVEADKEAEADGEPEEKLSVPPSFAQGVKDAEQGRVVDMETALNEPPPRRDFELASMSQEAAMADLQRHFPDIDVLGEYRKLKERCTQKGTRPTWNGFLGWLRKASPVVRLKRAHAPPAQRANGEQPITEEEQQKLYSEFVEMRRGAKTEAITS